MPSISTVAGDESQRATKFCSVAGLLVGVFTFGAAHIAFLLLPFVMAYTMFATERRRWLPLRKGADQPRRGFGTLMLTPLVVLLAAFPMFYLLLIFWAVALSPFLFALAPSKPGHGTAGEEPFMMVIGAACFATVVLLYAGLVGRALKQFTGRWFRVLFWKLVAWIAGLALIGFLVVSKFVWMFNLWSFLTTNWFLFPWWILCALAFYKVGAIFGEWLTRTDEAPGR
ncbi:MAG TPA: hypothetical protein VJN89_07605 [Candidatus Acidoferrum sp.]|nr:hypothetical protein [Candidatus Acidoferrum sp.]